MSSSAEPASFQSGFHHARPAVCVITWSSVTRSFAPPRNSGTSSRKGISSDSDLSRTNARTSAVVASLVSDARSKSESAVQGASGPALGSGQRVPAVYVSDTPPRSTRTTEQVNRFPIAASTIGFAATVETGSLKRSRAVGRPCASRQAHRQTARRSAVSGEDRGERLERGGEGGGRKERRAVWKDGRARP